MTGLWSWCLKIRIARKRETSTVLPEPDGLVFEVMGEERKLSFLTSLMSSGVETSHIFYLILLSNHLEEASD